MENGLKIYEIDDEKHIDINEFIKNIEILSDQIGIKDDNLLSLIEEYRKIHTIKIDSQTEVVQIYKLINICDKYSSKSKACQTVNDTLNYILNSAKNRVYAFILFENNLTLLTPCTLISDENDEFLVELDDGRVYKAYYVEKG